MVKARVFWAVAALGLLGCDALEQYGEASEMAQASVYYARLGTELNSVEQQGFPIVMEQLSAAVSNPSQRAPAVAAADAFVARIESVVERHRPDDPNHPGYQAARRMVEARRQAVQQLRQNFEAAPDVEAATHALLGFSSAWMSAQQQFMAAVGGHSQQIFGPAAQRAAEETGLGHVPIPPVPSPAGGAPTGGK